MRAHSFRIAVFPALLVTALASCTNLQWHRVGATTEALKEDLDQCRTSARLQAARGPWGQARSAPPMITYDQFGRPVAVQQQAYDGERFLAEHDYTNACMRQKGYELVPVDKETARP